MDPIPTDDETYKPPRQATSALPGEVAFRWGVVLTALAVGCLATAVLLRF
jgi:hypothetical protein